MGDRAKRQGPIDVNTLRDLLALVSVSVSLRNLRRWSDEERALAEQWAAKSHLRASDNIVRVPPRPPCVSRDGRQILPGAGLFGTFVRGRLPREVRRG